LLIAYGDAGWNGVSSSIGRCSLPTRPNTSDDAQTWITGRWPERWIASSRPAVPRMFVCSVSIGATKLCCG
jgi:hypothetical protein